MLTFLKRSLAAAVAAAAFLASPAYADPPPDSHHYWRNTNYPDHYVLYDHASRTWVETIGCRVAYRFTQVSNQMNELTLFDASRGMTVRLTYDGMFLKAAGDAGFGFYQSGTFDRRIRFSHRDAGGAYTGQIARTHGCGWEEWFPGHGGQPGFRFVQVAVTPGYVDVYDASRDMTARMDAGSLYLRQGDAPFAFFKAGGW
jgi:hypothetical protein